jgi:hypothetical protein
MEMPMTREIDELIRVVSTMPPEMAREVLNFALFLQRKQTEAAQSDHDESGDSRYGASGEGSDFLNRWDAVESPMGQRDVA